jgi:hypothetical protein
LNEDKCIRSLKAQLFETNRLIELEKEKEKLKTFYILVSNKEKAAVYVAMAHDFRGTGHWYYYENGHLFTIRECGMLIETS